MFYAHSVVDSAVLSVFCYFVMCTVFIAAIYQIQFLNYVKGKKNIGWILFRNLKEL